jgi:hypothetical protein
MQTSTTTCDIVGSSTICLTENNNVIAGFSYGEAFNILILLMILTILFFDKLKNWIFGVKIEQPVKMKYDK